MVRDFDILIYGATGFTGQFVTKQAVRQHAHLRLAIAGRSDTRLRALVAELNLPQGTAAPAVLIADAEHDPNALTRVALRTRVLINCVGPFRLYGRAVVHACIEAQTHYVDISGEPQHIEGRMAEFHDLARQNNVCIVPACGFDSIVADIGAVCYTASHLSRRADQTGLQLYLDSFLSFATGPRGGSVHTTTLRCALEGFDTVEELNLIRKSLPRAPAAVRPLRGEKRDGFFRDQRLGGNAYCTLFRGSDASVVRQSLRLSDIGAAAAGLPGSQDLAYSAYVVVGDWTNAMRYMFSSVLCLAFNMTSWGRALILKYPKWFTFGFFSNEGPTLQQIEDTSFSMTIYGTAKEENGNVAARIVTRVSGPEPGYDATSKIVTSAAVTLLEDRDDIPSGVLTPAAAFKNSRLITRLENCGALKFEVLS